MRKKKILYLSNRIRAGYFGTEKFLNNLITAIPEYEHTFIGHDEPFNKMFSELGYISINSFGGFEPDGWKKRLFAPISFVCGLYQFLRYFNFFKSADTIVLPASIIAESCFVLPYVKIAFPDKPIISLIHKNSCDDFIVKNWAYSLYRWVMSGPKSHQVFVAKSQQEAWVEKKAALKNSIYIFNGVRKESFECSKKSLENSKVLNIGFIGRIHLDKGLDVLAQALEKIQLNKETEIHLHIGGEGEDFEVIKPLFDQINRGNIIISWVGFVKDTGSFFSTLDLLIYPSRKEGFALVLLEAYERGLSVLTSDIPSFLEAKEYFGSFEKDLIFANENSSNLAYKLEYFLNNREKYSTKIYKTKLHEDLVKNFSLEKMAQNYKKIL